MKTATTTTTHNARHSTTHNNTQQHATTTTKQYGTIADCFTEMGDFESAAEWYDKYINLMNSEGPV